MAAITFPSKVGKDGSFAMPKEEVESFALHPGDEITVRIETRNGVQESDEFAQAELQRRAETLFEEADRLEREPWIVLLDPHGAA